MKKTIRYIGIPALAAGISLLAAGAALASDGGEEGIMTTVWQVVNFAILVAVLVYFGRKPFRDFLNARSEAIRKSLDDAREAKELAQKALDEVKKGLENKDREIEEIIAAAKASGQREREVLKEEGARMAEKLVEQARQNIEFEQKQASEAIKAEAVEIAMELAEKKLAGKLTDADRKRLFEEALAKLEEGRN